MFRKNTRGGKVQITVHEFKMVRGDSHVEANDVILTASGTDACDAAEAMRTQLAELFERLRTL